MASPPTITTARLLLRPFAAADAPAVQRIVSDPDIAATTATIPHPYPDGAAATWIAGHAAQHAAGTALVLAITTEAEGVVGAIGLMIAREHRHAELGYWIAKPAWNRGYATEAARAVMSLGFRELGLHRIWARHMTRNQASRRVLEKLGMVHEGRERQHLFRFGAFEDLEVWGLLDVEYAG